jgi:hypothetical protein
MICNTLDAASGNVAAFVMPTGRIVFQWRDKDMGIMRNASTDVNSVALPHCLRLTRKSNQFTVQHSGDGVQWEDVVDYQDPNKLTSIEIPMNETVHIGLVVSSHNSARTAEAQVSNVTFTGSVSPSGLLTLSQDISFQTLSDSDN